MKHLVVSAEEEQLDEIADFVMGELEGLELDEETYMQLEITIEEIFINIVSYAYTPETGDVEIGVSLTENPNVLEISFTDSGVPFNPLEKESADISAKALEEREGGLGIHMVRNLMDDVAYTYADGKNILRVKKYL